jgi:hypothetical protein
MAGEYGRFSKAPFSLIHNYIWRSRASFDGLQRPKRAAIFARLGSSSRTPGTGRCKLFVLTDLRMTPRFFSGFRFSRTSNSR